MMNETPKADSNDAASQPLFIFETAEAVFEKVRQAYMESRGREIGKRFYDAARVDPVEACRQLFDDGDTLREERSEALKQRIDHLAHKAKETIGDVCEAPLDTGRSLLEKGSQRVDDWASSASQKGRRTWEGLRQDLDRVKTSLKSVSENRRKQGARECKGLETRLDDLLKRLSQRMDLADAGELQAIKKAIKSLEEKVDSLRKQKPPKAED